MVNYVPDAHAGTKKAPVWLRSAEEENGVYKVIEDERVIIIRNGERYDVTGVRLAK